MLICLGILMITIREPPIPPEVEKVPGMTLWRSIREAATDCSTLCILAAIFAWFIAYNTLETWFTSYGVFTLGMEAATASFTPTLFALTFVLFAIPSGFIARFIGRKVTIIIGLIGMMVTVACVPLVQVQLFLMLLLGIGGFFWAMININSILWELSQRKLGSYTGIYYVFSQSAAALGPFFFGIMADVLQISLGYT